MEDNKFARLTGLTFNGSFVSDYVVEKREESLVRGRTSEELTEQFGFTVENSSTVIQSVCSAGFTTHDSDYNALGYSSMGVYMCRHADVCLHHAVVKFSGSPVIRLVVCKVCCVSRMVECQLHLILHSDVG